MYGHTPYAKAYRKKYQPTGRFVSYMGRDHETSPAEKRIEAALKQLKVNYEKEVSFNGLMTSYGNYYRFDFFVPRYSLIIEYDGAHHEADGKRYIDRKKENFAERHGMTVARFDFTNWKTLEDDVKELIEQMEHKKNRYNHYYLEDK
jgi:very-short-patch-repair endonuclease